MAEHPTKSGKSTKMSTEKLKDGSFEQQANKFKGQDPNSLVEDRFPSGGAK